MIAANLSETLLLDAYLLPPCTHGVGQAHVGLSNQDPDGLLVNDLSAISFDNQHISLQRSELEELARLRNLRAP